jgi:hypothetical protein
MLLCDNNITCPRPGRSYGDKLLIPPRLHDPLKSLHQGVIGTVHEALAESDFENFLEGKVRPHWVRKVPIRLEDFIGPERHARSHSHPFLLRPFGPLCLPKIMSERSSGVVLRGLER